MREGKCSLWDEIAPFEQRQLIGILPKQTNGKVLLVVEPPTLVVGIGPSIAEHRSYHDGRDDQRRVSNGIGATCEKS
jgi:hypothetical protein